MKLKLKTRVDQEYLVYFPCKMPQTGLSRSDHSRYRPVARTFYGGLEGGGGGGDESRIGTK